MSLRLIVILFVLVPWIARAEIFEAHAMRQALAGVREGDLVVLDIDETLLAYTLGTGGGVPTEEGLPELVAGLRAKGARVMGLTHRMTELAMPSSRQLRYHGLDLAKDRLFPNDPVVDPSDREARDFMGRLFDPDKRPKFYDGVLFISPARDKGTELISFLERARLSPKRIIFVDNLLPNVKSVAEACRAQDLPYRSVWYRAFETRGKVGMSSFPLPHDELCLVPLKQIAE